MLWNNVIFFLKELYCCFSNNLGNFNEMIREYNVVSVIRKFNWLNFCCFKRWVVMGKSIKFIFFIVKIVYVK